MLLALTTVACIDGTDEPRPFPDADLARYQHVCADGAVVEGIDVSYWQGTIEWDAVASDGIEFAIMRVSHGLGTYDTQFTRNWSESQRVGVRRGVYQYFDGNDDPVAQAQLLLSEMGPLQDGDFPPVLDVEQGDNEDVSVAQMVENIQRWMDVVEGELGVAPMIYAGAYGWTYLTGDADFTRHPLWTANWVDDCPLVPNPWDDWTFWQYSATGRVAGIDGNVDRDRFNGDAAALDAWAWHDEEECSGTCAVAAEGETVIQEDDPCACPEGRLSSIDGNGGHAYWTPADAGGDDALEWPLRLDRAGSYDVWVWIPVLGAPTAGAVYTIQHNGGTDIVTTDQAAMSGAWSLLGKFDFSAAGSQSVRVSDAWDDEANAGRDVGIDNLRLVPTSNTCECDTAESESQECSDGGTRGRDCEGCDWSAWTPCRGQADVVDAAACSCGTTGESVAGLLGLVAAAWSVRRRVRRA